MAEVILTRLQRWESTAEWALAACAVAFLVLYSVEILALPSGRTARLISILLFLLYLPFMVDYLVRLLLAENRVRWFLTHPLDLAVVTLPFLQPLRFLRLIAIIRILQRAFGDAVRGRVLSFIAVGGFLLIYSASLAELKYERLAPGSHITNFGDSIWWAVSTLTTVGYGDYVPVTTGGRIIAVCLMVGGISLIGAVTATVARWMVTEVEADDRAHQAVTVAHIDELHAAIARLETLVAETTTSRSRADGIPVGPVPSATRILTAELYAPAAGQPANDQRADVPSVRAEYHAPQRHWQKVE